jgi:H/ACA ribonucleoprotein complex subunit 4
VDVEALAEDNVIKPSKEGVKLDSATWPLLLKNYERMNVRTSHYTPIPMGSVNIIQLIQY